MRPYVHNIIMRISFVFSSYTSIAYAFIHVFCFNSYTTYYLNKIYYNHTVKRCLNYLKYSKLFFAIKMSGKSCT